MASPCFKPSPRSQGSCRGAADLGPVPEGALRVYVIRHGQAYTNLTPPPALPPDQLDRLTLLGHAQSKAAAAALKERGISVIMTSRKGRAQETADELRVALGVRVRVDERLRWTWARTPPARLSNGATG